MNAPEVLVVDDDATLAKVLCRELQAGGYRVEAFGSSTGVLERIGRDPPQAVLLDLRLPGQGGMELLAAIRARDPDQQVVVFTGHGSVTLAVEAMRMGAFDFLVKPVQLDVLEQTLNRAVQTYVLLQDNRRLRRAVQGSDSQPMRGSSPAMADLQALVQRIAPSPGPVLVQGEHGTGKELVARSIHESSARRDQPFVVVNCGAIPAMLVESELFGHERGAFTGADRRRTGLFEAADGGTLFLDEIGELPIAVQPVLLRALQFGEIRSVGSERVRRVDVRVVAATNRDLLARIKEQQFREDLYYRIAALVVEVPPLRIRPEDIDDLSAHFLNRSATRMGRRLSLDPAALARLKDHDWPGNVRELENACERLAVMCVGTEVKVADIERFVMRRPDAEGHLPTLDLARLESIAIHEAMARHSGDKPAAARALGVSLSTLYNKLERLQSR